MFNYLKWFLWDAPRFSIVWMLKHEHAFLCLILVEFILTLKGFLDLNILSVLNLSLKRDRDEAENFDILKVLIEASLGLGLHKLKQKNIVEWNYFNFIEVNEHHTWKKPYWRTSICWKPRHRSLNGWDRSKPRFITNNCPVFNMFSFKVWHS